MKQINILTFFLSLLLFTTSCSNNETTAEKKTNVKTFVVNCSSADNMVEFPGKVVAAEEVNVSFKVSGTLQRILIKEGDKFRKGQVLAEMDITDYLIQLNATEAEYHKVKAEAERVIALYNDSVATPDAYDKARYGLQQITAKYENAKNQLSYTKIYAPFDGLMQKHIFDAGTIISAGMPVASIISAGTPEIEINIPISTYIHRNQIESVYAKFDYLTDDIRLGIISISPKANANQLYTVRLSIPQNISPNPTPGMSTNVKLFFTGDSSENIIPSSALFQDGGTQCVWIVTSDSIAEKREVTVKSLLNDGNAVISSGLENGERIITAGTHKIRQGQKVTIIEEPSETNIGGLL